MSYGEKEKALIKKAEAPYYQERLKEVEERKKKEEDLKDIISSDEMPWEVCQQGTNCYIGKAGCLLHRSAQIGIYMHRCFQGNRYKCCYSKQGGNFSREISRD